jgi:hypothetical protein
MANERMQQLGKHRRFVALALTRARAGFRCFEAYPIGLADSGVAPSTAARKAAKSSLLGNAVADSLQKALLVPAWRTSRTDLATSATREASARQAEAVEVALGIERRHAATAGEVHAWR